MLCYSALPHTCRANASSNNGESGITAKLRVSRECVELAIYLKRTLSRTYSLNQNLVLVYPYYPSSFLPLSRFLEWARYIIQNYSKKNVIIIFLFYGNIWKLNKRITKRKEKNKKEKKREETKLKKRKTSIVYFVNKYLNSYELIFFIWNINSKRAITKRTNKDRLAHFCSIYISIARSQWF